MFAKTTLMRGLTLWMFQLQNTLKNQDGCLNNEVFSQNSQLFAAHRVSILELSQGSIFLSFDDAVNGLSAK